LHDTVTWYGINYTGRKLRNGTSTSSARLSFVFLKVPLRNLRHSIFYSVSCLAYGWSAGNLS